MSVVVVTKDVVVVTMSVVVVTMSVVVGDNDRGGGDTTTSAYLWKRVET